MDTTKTSIHEFFDSLTENAGATALSFNFDATMRHC